MINKNFFNYKTHLAFLQDKQAGNIPDTAICFIEDEKIIYTHGVEYYSPDDTYKDILYGDETDEEVTPLPDIVTVDRAVADGLGNNITNTYATKSELTNVTPTIGLNDNWFINGEDTGKSSKGADGVSLGEIALVLELSTEAGSESKVISQKVVSENINNLNSKASQTYDNFAAIEASGETDKNKIFIDAETNTSYRWNGEKYVSIGGGDNNVVFEDYHRFPIFYVKDNIIYYVNTKNKLASWNEATKEKKVYDKISYYPHSYHKSYSVPMIVKDNKVIVAGSGGANCYDLDTQEKLWNISADYYNVHFEEFGEHIYFIDNAENTGSIKRISLDDGGILQTYNLTDLCGGNIRNNFQKFGDCIFNDDAYIVYNSHIFKIAKDTGDITYVGKIDSTKMYLLMLNAGANTAFLVGEYYCASMDFTAITGGTFKPKTEKKYAMDTYLYSLSLSKYSLFKGCVYKYDYSINVGSVFGIFYLYANIDMRKENKGIKIALANGFLRIPSNDTTNDKPYYKQYENKSN